VSVLALALSIPLILEFVFAPVNLWTGRTISNFVRFTGYEPRIANRVFAPIKLATAGLLALGLAVPSSSVTGASAALAISLVYIARLLAPVRRDPAGLLGFLLFGLLAAALLTVRLLA
jgi:hypothetical protein